MIKLVLLNASDFLKVDSYPSLGIGSIKAYLLSKHKDISIKIFRQDLVENIKKQKPDILGISTISFNFPDAIDLARIIREEFPNIKIILGGPHITVLPKTLDKVFDCGVIGEGEETMDELVDLFKQNRFKTQYLKKVKGICYIDKNSKLHITPKRSFIKDINTLPHIDRSDFNNEKYAYVFSLRGCFYDCSYCAASQIWGRKMARLFTAEYIFTEIKQILALGYKKITLDEMFFYSTSRTQAIINLINNEKNNFYKPEFNISVLAIMVTDELCNILNKMNIASIRFNAYSGSSRILNSNKNIDANIVKNAFLKLKRTGIPMDIGYMINSSDENIEDFFSTFRFIKKLNLRKFRFSFNFLNPGSSYWKLAIENNLLSKVINYRLLDWDKGINQINEFNFVNLTKEKTSTLIKWAREINNLKKERSGLAFISFLINKIKRINKYKLIFKYSNFLYYLGLKDRLFYPKTILINCNNICNFNCSFCINKDTRTLLFKEQDFSLKDLNKIISEISAFNPYICITGGEPLLNKEIFKIIYTLKKNGIKRVELLTNGFLIKKYFSELILSGLDTITISLDHYLSEKHDEIRGVKGAFNSLLEGLILLRDFKNKYGDVININITTVINKENYKDLANMYDFIEKIGLINVWQIRHLVYLNENNFFLQKKQKNNKQIPINNVIGFLHKNDYFSKDELDILKEQLKIIKLKSFFNKTKLVVAPNKIDIDKYYSNFEFSKNRICNDIFESIQIKNGKISTRCDYILGDLTGGILKTWNSKKNLNFLSYIKENGLPQCWRCTRRNYS